MKHFVITYTVGHTPFTYECTTAAEAFAALMDIGADDENSLPLESADYYMKLLVDMRYGTKLSHEHMRFRIAYVDGEV